MIHIHQHKLCLKDTIRHLGVVMQMFNSSNGKADIKDLYVFQVILVYIIRSIKALAKKIRLDLKKVNKSINKTKQKYTQ